MRKKSWDSTKNRKPRIERIEKERILIVCEGEKTEPNYFISFKVSSATVDPVGTGTSTLKLIKRTIELRDEAVKANEKYDQIWCVFDKDSFSDDKFNNAIKMAESNNFYVAYSNECFEIWYLLHFHYYNSQISRRDYTSKLKKHLG